jgi:cyclic pyranopterin phosphate synthase
MGKTLIDPFGRQIEYIRLSVTDRCDLRCSYCLPRGYRNFSEANDWLTFDEIERVIRVFTELGVRRVRLTGGEPLTRHNLAELAARLHALPLVEDLSLSTNGVQLKKHAPALRRAGVQRVNVGLSSLQPERFAAITGGRLDKVLDGLAAAKEAGMHPIKINMVVMKGINDDEIENMLEFCIEHDFTLRLIETMPMGATGRRAAEHYLELQAVRQRLAETFELVPSVMPGGGPARYMQVAGTNLKIGFITPMSQHFCETCNRVRLAADGVLYLCLGQNDKVELRPLLRQGVSDGRLEDALRAATARKPERHQFQEQPQKIIRSMAITGG